MEQDEQTALDKNFFLKIIRFGFSRPDGFTSREITETLAPVADWEREVLESYIKTAWNAAYGSSVRSAPSNESLFFVTKLGSGWGADNTKYVIGYEAFFNYLDYKELSFARENAKEARRHAIVAIWISAIALVVSAIVPVLISLQTQDVRLPPAQMDQLRSVRADK